MGSDPTPFFFVNLFLFSWKDISDMRVLRIYAQLHILHHQKLKKKNKETLENEYFIVKVF